MYFHSRFPQAARRLSIAALCIVSMSFAAIQINPGFLKELGISQAEADNKINQGLLSGHINTYALGQAKKIPAPAHAAIVESAFAYVRNYTASAAFKEEYEKKRLQARPVLPPLPLTPDSMRQDLIRKAQQTLEAAEAALKGAPADSRHSMEEMVAAAKENLEEYKKPDNAYIEMYASNYASLLETAKSSQKQLLSQWEQQYPAQLNAFIKTRLQQLMAETKDVDFAATTVAVNGKLKFTNPAYERKSNNWKLAYRMGETAVRAARTQATRWLADL